MRLSSTARLPAASHCGAQLWVPASLRGSGRAPPDDEPYDAWRARTGGLIPTLGDGGRADRSVGEIYAARMAGGAHAVVMFNRNGAPASMTLELGDIVGDAAAAGTDAWEVRDLWAHTDNGTVSTTGSIAATVGGTDVVMLTLRPR